LKKELEGLPFIPPEKSVKIALKERCRGLSWTYNEPTLWLECTLKTAQIAGQAGLPTNYVTNDYLIEEALDALCLWLDSFREKGRKSEEPGSSPYPSVLHKIQSNP